MLKIPAWWSGEDVTRGAGGRTQGNGRGCCAGLPAGVGHNNTKGQSSRSGVQERRWPLARPSFPEPYRGLEGRPAGTRRQGPGPGPELEHGTSPAAVARKQPGTSLAGGPASARASACGAHATQPLDVSLSLSIPSAGLHRAVETCTSAGFWSRCCRPLRALTPPRKMCQNASGVMQLGQTKRVPRPIPPHPPRRAVAAAGAGSVPGCFWPLELCVPGACPLFPLRARSQSSALISHDLGQCHPRPIFPLLFLPWSFFSCAVPCVHFRSLHRLNRVVVPDDIECTCNSSTHSSTITTTAIRVSCTVFVHKSSLPLFHRFFFLVQGCCPGTCFCSLESAILFPPEPPLSLSLSQTHAHSLPSELLGLPDAHITLNLAQPPHNRNTHNKNSGSSPDRVSPRTSRTPSASVSNAHA